jgi:uncharacterized protein (DUF362 family)
METNDFCGCLKKQYSRRNFLTTLGATTAGLLINPFKQSKNIFAFTHDRTTVNSVQVAVTQADNYSRDIIKQKVQHIFEAMGGVSDVIKAGDRVAIKINLTGGSSNANHRRLKGVDIRESVWTHPEVIRAVGELIIDSGVSASDLYIVEAIWDAASYNDFGYLDVQQGLGAQLVDLNHEAPYSDFIDKEVGEDHFFYSSFKLNRILDEVDVFVSIPKMKQHYDAGVTHSMKNLVGIVPIQYYMMPNQPGYRSALHLEGGNIRTHLPRSICDLNMARPINLAVIDGIKNAISGEGPWISTFQPAEYHLLLAGKDPVATDSVASFQMGNDPEAEKLQLPNGEQCDNYLELLHQKNMGTNQMDEIELVGDGASLITSVRSGYARIIPTNIKLFQNYPNPFNQATTIKYYLPKSEHVSLKIFNTIGQEIETLVSGYIPAGEHQLRWTVKSLPSAIYYYKLQVGEFSETRKLIFQK